MFSKTALLLTMSAFAQVGAEEMPQGSQVMTQQEREAWWSTVPDDQKVKLESLFYDDWFDGLEDDERLSYVQLASSLYDFATSGADSDPTDHYTGFAPLLLRTSFHLSGTYHHKSGMGGSNGGTIFQQGELDDEQNGCINVATSAIRALFQGHNVPLADAVVIGGVVALDVMNFPRMDLVTVEGGREDLDHTAFRDRLPSADDDPLNKFMTLYDLSVPELVALIGGAHNVGSAHGKCSGYVGQWTATPLSWSGPNDSPPTFFPDLLREDWRWYEVCTFTNNTVRYVSIEDPFANGGVPEEEHEEDEEEDACLVSNSVVPLICEEQAMRGCSFEDGWYGLDESPCDINMLQFRLKSDFFLKANPLMLPHAQAFADDADLLAEQFGIAYHKLTHLGLGRCGMSGHGCEEGTICEPGEAPGGSSCVLDTENFARIVVDSSADNDRDSSDDDDFSLGKGGSIALFVLLGVQVSLMLLMLFKQNHADGKSVASTETPVSTGNESGPTAMSSSMLMKPSGPTAMSSSMPMKPEQSLEC